MTPEQEKHLQFLKDEFCKQLDEKYRKGQEEHGGDIWLKSGMLKNMTEEILDQWVYAKTLEFQMKEGGVESALIRAKSLG